MISEDNARRCRHFRVAESRNENVRDYGAWTKKNVLLQLEGIAPRIAEINDDKLNCVALVLWISIMREAEARAMNPDYRSSRGGKLVFPLAELEGF